MSSRVRIPSKTEYVKGCPTVWWIREAISDADAGLRPGYQKICYIENAEHTANDLSQVISHRPIFSKPDPEGVLRFRMLTGGLYWRPPSELFYLDDRGILTPLQHDSATRVQMLLHLMKLAPSERLQRAAELNLDYWNTAIARCCRSGLSQNSSDFTPILQAYTRSACTRNRLHELFNSGPRLEDLQELPSGRLPAQDYPDLVDDLARLIRVANDQQTQRPGEDKAAAAARFVLTYLGELLPGIPAPLSPEDRAAMHRAKATARFIRPKRGLSR